MFHLNPFIKARERIFYAMSGCRLGLWGSLREKRSCLQEKRKRCFYVYSCTIGATAKAGQNLPDKEFCNLRTIYYSSRRVNRKYKYIKVWRLGVNDVYASWFMMRHEDPLLHHQQTTDNMFSTCW